MQEPNYVGLKTIQEEDTMNTNIPEPAYALETERLLLRPMIEGDAEGLHEIMSSAAPMEYWSCPPHTELSQTISFVQSSINSPPADYDLSILLKPASSSSAPKFIGKVGVWEGAIGFILHSSVWRKGIASEAMAVFLEQYWKIRPESEHLMADVDPRNIASLALLMKFGFKETSRVANTFLTHLGWCDSVYLRLDRPRVVVDEVRTLKEDV